MSSGVTETQDARIAALQVEIAELRRSVRRLELKERAGGQSHAATGNLPAPPAKLATEQALDRVRRLTEAIFPGGLSVEVMSDPEAPDERFVVFNVTAAGDVEELLRRQRQWHDEVQRRAPDALNLFRISVTPT